MRSAGRCAVVAMVTQIVKTGRKEEREIPPEIVVGVPHRDAVLMTTTASTKGGLEQIRSMVSEIHAKDEVHGLTRDLFVRRQNKWEVFERAS